MVIINIEIINIISILIITINVLNDKVSSEDKIKTKFVVNKVEKCINSRLNFYYQESYSSNEAIFDCQKEYILNSSNINESRRRDKLFKSVGLTGVEEIK